MEFKYKYTCEGSISLSDDNLDEIANRLISGDDIYNILQDIFDDIYGYDNDYIDIIEYVEDDVKKYIEEHYHYKLSDNMTIKWLIDLIKHKSHININTDHYNIYCNYNRDYDNFLIGITIRADGEILNKVRIFIDGLSKEQFEVAVYDGGSYISNVGLYDKISFIDGLNKYMNILILLENKDV